MMSTESSTTEPGQRHQTNHSGEIYEQSSHERDPFKVHSLLESFDRPPPPPPPPPPPSGDSQRASKGNLPSRTSQGSAVTLGKTTTADVGGISERGNSMVSVTVRDSSSSKVTSDTSIIPPISSASTTSIVTTTTAIPTPDSTPPSKATISATTTTTFSRGRPPLTPFSRSQILRPKMGLYHPTIGVNGHALPRGAGESRDAPRNPSALPMGPPDSTACRRERLIGPVTACVAPPPLRIADAQRERDRLVSASQNLMSKPVKRKLFDVDHDTLGPEIEAELKQIIEEDEKRFKERWMELGPDECPGAPSFYLSEVTPPKKRKTTARSTSEAEASTSRPPLADPVNTKSDKDRQVSSALKSKPGSKPVNADAEKTRPPPFHVDRKKSNNCPKADSKQPKVPSELSSKKPDDTRQVKVKETLSRGDSSLDVFSSSSTSDVSSLETTSTKTTAISPLAKNMPSVERTPRTRSMTSAQEKTAQSQRPVTRSSRSTSLKSYSQTHLRM